MKASFKSICFGLAITLFGMGQLPLSMAHAQQPKPPTNMERDNARDMLSSIRSDLEKYYYDPNYHGMNLDERFKAANEKVAQAASLAQLMGIIGQVLLDLNDSHTGFLPPPRTYRTDYGWRMQMIGDRCFAVGIKPGSDAETKGLKEGDEVNSIDGLQPSRTNLWKILYLYHAIRPRQGMRLAVTKPDGKQEQLDVAAKVREVKRVLDFTAANQGYDTGDLIREAENEAHLNRHRYLEIGDTFIWKMPGFDLDKLQVDDMMSKVKKRKSLILDLRGNGGGYEETMLRLIANTFAHDVQLGQVKRRKETKPLVAKTRGDAAYDGKIIVLVDSDSASAAEVFARVIQLEKRGIVIGDRTSGAVMRSLIYPHSIGYEVRFTYAVSITDADVIMKDGASLEHVGVQPDEVRLPSSTDLAEKRDGVLAYAASLVGLTITPEKAGGLFPLEWKK